MTTAGEITEFPIPTANSGSYNILAGPDGNLYFAESSAGKIGRITTVGQITEIPLPPPAFPGELTVGPDGAIWLVDSPANQIRKMTVETGICSLDSTTLCLSNSRFRVTASWRKPNDTSGPAQAVPLTSDTGAFWFFAPANIELVVKVLGGCLVNGHYWVFGAGLTNVEVMLSVTDMQTNSVRTYSNALGTAFQPIQDTSAFDCP